MASSAAASLLSVLLLLSVIAVIALVSTVRAEKAATRPVLKCAEALRLVDCTVTLAIDDGSVHVFELIEDVTSVFHSQTEVVLPDGTKVKASENKPKDTVRLVSKPGSRGYATISASRDGSQIIEGVFNVPHKGFFEFNHASVAPNDDTVRRRRLTNLFNDVEELAPGYLRRSTLAAADGDDWLANAVAFSAGSFVPFFPNCYAMDSLTHVARISVALDLGLVNSLGGPSQVQYILNRVESEFAIGRLMFLAQLNIRLDIQTIVLGDAASEAPLSNSRETGCSGAVNALNDFRLWLSKNNRASQAAYWILLSNCFGQVNGHSTVGTVCGQSGNGGVATFAWPVIFHEIGHGFGMQHTINAGGLMDYGDITYNGIVQYHPLSRADVCPALNIVKNLNTPCPHFFVSDAVSSCGDGVLAKNEDCECIDRSRSCNGCNNCKRTNASVQCSTTTYVVRDAASPDYVVVSQDSLSSSECCVDGRLAPPKTLCGPGLRDACGPSGKCISLCTRYFEANTENCGFDDYGCLLGCLVENRCRFEIWNGERTEIFNALPDGSACTFRGLQGQCKNAVCHTALGTPPPTAGTSRPTRSPFYNEPEFTERPTSQKPTKKPTPQPTGKPTKAPTLRPTKRPTPAPTDPAARITLEPTMPNPAKLEKNCRAQNKKRNKCKKRANCSWCAANKRCVYDYAANCPQKKAKKKSG